jgi:hypothetical protein
VVVGFEVEVHSEMKIKGQLTQPEPGNLARARKQSREHPEALIIRTWDYWRPPMVLSAMPFTSATEKIRFGLSKTDRKFKGCDGIE